MNIKKSIYIFLIFGLCNNFLANNVTNRNEIYKVEVIVFSNNVSPDNLYSNFDKLTIPKNANVLKKKTSINNQIEPQKKPLPELYTKLDSKDHNLKSFDAKLVNSNNYKIISHYAWYQDLSKKSGAYLNGGMNYSKKEKELTRSEIISNVSVDDSDKFNNNHFKFLNPEWELEGFIELQKFTRSKIHVDMNLLINTPVNLAGYSHYKTFSIKQNINLNINEAVYFDNPYFGAIMYISKYES